MAVEAAATRQDERAWWLRVPLVLAAPRQVFAAFRDDSDEAAEARQEPVAATVLLAGAAIVLSTTTAHGLLDDRELDGLLAVVWTIVTGAVNGVVGYLVVGGLAYLGASFAGGLGSYRRARHVLAYACVPAALSLLAGLARVAAFGAEAFRSGGPDDGAAGDALSLAVAACGLWSVWLLVLGTRVVHGWTWTRSAAACVLPAAVAGAVLARATGLA